jgi:hypothetical protein
MTDTRLVARGAPGGVARVAADQNVRAIATRDGAQYSADWLMALALEGRIYTASVGTITTPITFGAFDADQPELALLVPATHLILPLSIQVHIEDAAGTDNEIFFITSTATVTAGTSTAVTPVNHLVGNTSVSGCTVLTAYSGNGTDPYTGTTNEFWRTGYAFADTTVGPHKVYSWNWRDYAPIAVTGVGSLVGYVSATTTQMNGFIKVTWAELPASTNV